MAPVLHLLLLLLLSTGFSSADPLDKTCSGGNYTTNSTYNSNLNSLLTFFTSLNSTSFATRAQGSTPDGVYGLILCRGDVGPSECTSCIRNATQDALSLCPGSKRATLWYDNCELRYSDLRFFSTVRNSNPLVLYNEQNVTDHVENFIQMQGKLLDKVTYQASYNSSLMFATGAAIGGSDVTVNGLAQCTRDLSKDGCSQCLKEIRGTYAKLGLEASQGGRVLGESCNFRYEVYPFYQGKPTVVLNLTALPSPSAPSPPPLSPPPPSPSAPSPPPLSPSTPTTSGEKGGKNNPGKVLRIVIPIVLVFVDIGSNFGGGEEEV